MGVRNDSIQNFSLKAQMLTINAGERINEKEREKERERERKRE